MGRSSRIGSAALLVASFALAAEPLLHGLHFQSVRHFFCPEHRHLAHGAAEHGHSAALEPGSLPAVGGSARHGGEPLDHRGCTLQVGGSQSKARLRSGASSPERQPSPADAPRRALPPARAVPILAQAPKASPPSEAPTIA